VQVLLTPRAAADLAELARDRSAHKRLKSVRKALGLLETNRRHPSLHTHEFKSLVGPKGEKMFEAYAKNKTPAAYRIFFYYGPGKDQLTVIAITPHP
jgi:hypothetical protein